MSIPSRDTAAALDAAATLPITTAITAPITTAIKTAAYDAIIEATKGFDRPDDAFDPYADRHPAFDRPDAVAIRRENLQSYFDQYQESPSLFLLAEAPGPWGCRFSGVPITSEEQLVDPEFPLPGRQASTREQPHGEYSANIFWKLLQDHFPRFFVWNAYPLHPFREGQPLTIRAPRTSELRAFSPLVATLIRLMAPKKVLAVGRKAEKSLGWAGIDCTYVRHPSQGGARLFAEGVERALRETGHADG